MSAPRALRALSARALYFGRTALRGLRASPLTSMVAVLTIAVTLVLAGAFALVVKNMQGVLERIGEDVTVTAYLEDGLADQERAALAARVKTVEGVQEVVSVSKDEARRRFERAGQGRGDLLQALGENPLPASLEISLAPDRRNAEGVRVVVESLQGLPGIAELANAQDWVRGYASALSLLRGVGFGLGIVLALATLLIVSNTIRLAVYARRDEIEILTLVGASRTFVAIPFLLEGALQGALGGALAVGGLAGLYRLVLPSLASALTLVFGDTPPAFFTPSEMLVLIAVGALLGMFSSAASLVGGLRQ
ncbi:MAG TPA: permease-like cell division protein FtsX [Myxococcota bacterium]|nr:permease-like cell division protein FtsX [Myxococcota bacterium]